MLLYFLTACSISLLLGARGEASSNSNQSCIFANFSNYVQVSAGSAVQAVNLTFNRNDILHELCAICNCSVSPCLCSHISPDLAWVATHPLQHLLLLVTILLPNQLHLRRPRTVRASNAAA
uniref:GP3 protein n=1 Tax=Mikumi yellow baboon virus 1 TaxID=1546177 RepID=A0A089G0K9_9NIDO|nr:GP3 protein [Mikumi yellow baboon virus 1]